VLESKGSEYRWELEWQYLVAWIEKVEREKDLRMR